MLLLLAAVVILAGQWQQRFIVCGSIVALFLFEAVLVSALARSSQQLSSVFINDIQRWMRSWVPT